VHYPNSRHAIIEGERSKDWPTSTIKSAAASGARNPGGERLRRGVIEREEMKDLARKKDGTKITIT
jgi:hypothetical protein